MTEAIAAPAPTDRRTLYPDVGASEKIMAAASPIFQPPRSAKLHENRRNERKTRVFVLNNFIASSPSLLRARRFEAPSARPRDPEGDGFQAWAEKGEAGSGAHATTQAVALVYSPRCSSQVSRVLCDLLRHFGSPHILRTMRAFLDRKQIIFFSLCQIRFGFFFPNWIFFNR